jgi:hypothetical protein
MSATDRDYPYDPAADVTKLHGLDKLRAVADRGTAAYLHRLYVQLEPTWRRDDARADFGAGGTAQFPDDYSAFDVVQAPEAGTAAREVWDRKNAVVFHAWEQWSRDLEVYKMDYFERIGAELSRDQAAKHRERFAQAMRREYGFAYPDPKWLDEHNAWQERR